jgi:hypothetical protein
MPTARGVLNRLLIRNARVDREETRVHVCSQAVYQSPKQCQITDVGIQPLDDPRCSPAFSHPSKHQSRQCCLSAVIGRETEY